VIPRELVTELMERFSVPGVAVGVRHGDDEETAGFGVTSADHPLVVDADTLFQIGSITKTYTAAAAMRLVEDGRLDLDAPIRDVLPELRLADEDVAARASMRHLLSHTGGWTGDYFDVVGPGDDALALMVARLDQLEQLTPLGEIWSYNNSGFYIVGRAIEVIVGKPFEAALQELVLEPLGLERSFFFAEDVITHRFAVGHDRTGAVARPWAIGRPAAPAGGIVASVRELLLYAKLVFGETDLLRPESIAAMREPQAEVGFAMGDSVGLGWYLFERGGFRFVTHGGATNGQQALFVACPEERFAFAVLANHADGSALSSELRTAFLRDRLGIEAPAETRIAVQPDELATYSGSYDSSLTRADVTVDDGTLVLQLTPKGGFPTPESPPTPGPPPTRVALERANAIIALDEPLKGSRGDFLRDEQGQIAWFRISGRIHRRLEGPS
jgi:CubicO group peptidase (beta-lactamase class C family)